MSQPQDPADHPREQERMSNDTDTTDDASGRETPSPAAEATPAIHPDGMPVYHLSGGEYLVGGEGNENVYRVQLAGRTCSCDDYQHRKRDEQNAGCKHIRKVLSVGPSNRSMEDMAVEDIVAIVTRGMDAVGRLEAAEGPSGQSTNGQAHAATETPQTGDGDGPSTADELSPSREQKADYAADKLQEAYDDVIDDMQVKPHAGYVWVQTGASTPDEWPHMGGNDTWTVLLKNPETVEYVYPPDDDRPGHDLYDQKPGQWWKNVIDPDDVDDYLEEVGIA
jgi:hypothetical protein